MRRTLALVLATVASATALTLGTAGAAQAAPATGGVTVYGFADCQPPGGTPQTARKVRFQTGAGEAVDATVNGYTRYVSARLNRVPTSGTVLYAYVYCGYPDNSSSPARWGRGFTVKPSGIPQYLDLRRWQR